MIFRFFCSRARQIGRTASFALLIALVSALLPSQTGTALAQAAVRYNPADRTIYIGDPYNANDPFAGNPSAAGAPKTAITLPQIDAALAAAGQPDLLIDQGGGVWLLNADMVVNQNSRLEISGPTVTELRLDSTPRADRAAPFLTKIIAQGGHLLIQNTKVVSWAGEGVDQNYADGRSYLLAYKGGRMDIRASEIAHLGWEPGEPSGISWRERGAPSDPKTGATGEIVDSVIRSNYKGQYSYEAYGIKILRNQFYSNTTYGIDPHDFSESFEVAFNTVFNNGKHGIIFSRGCINNHIHNNTVYGNAEHGIMLDRGSNKNLIENNTVYNNGDGIAIFQSEENTVRNNTLRDNARGVRINATFAPGDEYDGVAANNTIVGNIIQTSSEYGIYLYQRADKNTIEGNTISDSGRSGVYIKTGGNIIKGNTIRTNGAGITILGTETYTTGGKPAIGKPGEANVIQSNTIEDNDGIGVQFKGASKNQVGGNADAPQPGDANTISNNGSHGVSFDATSANNTVAGNIIHGNGLAGSGDGVISKGAGSVKNRVTKNSITANTRSGVRVDDGAASGLQGPTITSAPDATTVTGTAAAGATVEVYRDPNGQGNVYLGAATTGGDGKWSFALPQNDDKNAGAITALAIDKTGNTSSFGGIGSSGSVNYQILPGRNGELTISIRGQGTTVTLPDIERAVKAIRPSETLLENQGNGVWQTNASLFIGRGVTLRLTPETATWLKLRSQATDILTTNASEPQYNYRSFTTLRTYNGAILIDGVRVTSWDPQANTYDTDVSNGRSYVLAKYEARLDIRNADLSYLGSADGESYGVSWRDTNGTDEAGNPGPLRTRVTGEVLNSTFSHNYYGIYTYQAANMVFRGNKFHNNISYGFDPHDFTNNVLVENNEAFENGNHGFIISRGCTNFTIRGNKSYNNRNNSPDGRLAHGFMIDPGSPNSRYPQVPSTKNLLENNEAWGNNGYGLRMVNAAENTIRNNRFTNNLQGITLEQGSTGNIVQGNTITESGLYGVFLFGGADGNTIDGNTITSSGRHGIYVKTGRNTITNNTLTSNGRLTSSGLAGSGIAFLQDVEIVGGLIADLRLPDESVSLAVRDPELFMTQAAATLVTNNTVAKNTATYNGDEGIELKGVRASVVEDNVAESNRANGIYLTSASTGNMIRRNAARNNKGHGIRANGADTVGNTWTENRVTGNGGGGIVTTSSANSGIKPPKIAQKDRTVTGTAAPGAMVEIYSDSAGQGWFFEGRTQAGPDGAFTFVAAQPWQAPTVNATMTDGQGNTSGFAFNVGSAVAAGDVYLPLVRR
jgi:parallel beta-helix repeat protein